MRRAALALSTALIAASALALGAAQAQDRYGPRAGAGLTPVSYASDQPLLSWPGKRPAPTDESAAPQRPAAPPASIYTPPPQPAPPPVRETPPPPVVRAAPAPVSVYTPPPAPAPKPPVATASLDMRPLLPASRPKPVHVAATPAPTVQVVHATASKPPKSAPTSPVKVAGTPPVKVTAAAQSPAEPDAPHKPWSATGAGGVPAHFYSTVREFGLKPDPDPAPLPAQFFADQSGGDLAAPPPPLEPHPVPGSQTVDSTATSNTASNRARAIALDTPSPDGSDN